MGASTCASSSNPTRSLRDGLCESPSSQSCTAHGRSCRARCTRCSKGFPSPLCSSRLTQYRYVRAHTNVPVPQVYAYGRASLRHDDSNEQSCYMMMEHAAGQPLDAEFFKSPPERRQHFFADLINILAELRGLEFHAAGSLMPSTPGDMSSDPVVVNTISMPINELYIQGGYTASSAPVASPPSSTANFVAQEHRLLWDTYLMPMQDLLEEDAQSEVFALYTLQRHTQKQYQRHRQQPERFASTHADLRGPNILLDNELRIKAIIDWEWAATVPISFFTPPLWISVSKDRLAEFVLRWLLPHLRQWRCCRSSGSLPITTSPCTWRRSSSTLIGSPKTFAN